jgi:DNA-binding XRE family transcriptional regulator
MFSQKIMSYYRGLSTEERIEKHIVSKDDCWLTDFSSANNYPETLINGKKTRISHFIYKLHKGEIPEGMCICHTCDNTKCVNPDHLFLGTHQDNVKDKVKKNRQAKGSKHGKAKLNEEKVLEIQKLLAEKNLTQKEIGKKYGVHEQAISEIKRGKNWSHVTDKSTTNNTTIIYNGSVTNNITINCSECPRQLNLFDLDEFK